jgi:hypothetical protein
MGDVIGGLLFASDSHCPAATDAPLRAGTCAAEPAAERINGDSCSRSSSRSASAEDSSEALDGDGRSDFAKPDLATGGSQDVDASNDVLRSPQLRPEEA